MCPKSFNGASLMLHAAVKENILPCFSYSCSYFLLFLFSIRWCFITLISAIIIVQHFLDSYLHANSHIFFRIVAAGTVSGSA